MERRRDLRLLSLSLAAGIYDSLKVNPRGKQRRNVTYLTTWACSFSSTRSEEVTGAVFGDLCQFTALMCRLHSWAKVNICHSSNASLSLSQLSFNQRTNEREKQLFSPRREKQRERERNHLAELHRHSNHIPRCRMTETIFLAAVQSHVDLSDTLEYTGCFQSHSVTSLIIQRLAWTGPLSVFISCQCIERMSVAPIAQFFLSRTNGAISPSKRITELSFPHLSARRTHAMLSEGH